MMIHPGFVGIDISKSHLDVFDGTHATPEKLANNADAIASLVSRWSGQDTFVLFEATGPYDDLLRRTLAVAGIDFARVNPARARDFARAIGAIAKTDAIDAKMLAAMAQTLRPAADQPPSVAHQALADLNKRRDQLVATRKQERARRDSIDDLDITADIDAHIEWLAKRIKAIERKIRDLITAEPKMAQDQRLLQSVPGIGPVAATTVLSLMPELGTRSPKTIAALAGLAPFNVDSGQFRGKRVIKGGRRRVRQALYMAALSAMRHNPRLSAFYNAIIERSKAAKIAIIAVARKLIVICNAIIRTQTPYRA